MTRVRTVPSVLLAMMLGLLAAVIISPGAAMAAPSIPDRPDKYVANVDKVLTADEQQGVEEYLTGVHGAHDQRVWVYIARSLDEETSSEVAKQIIPKWGLTPDDVLLVLASEDGTVRVNVGAHSREAVTDDEATKIAQTALGTMSQGQPKNAIMGAITETFFALEGVDPSVDHPHDDVHDEDHSEEGITQGPGEQGKSASDGSGNVSGILLGGLVAGAVVLGALYLLNRRRGDLTSTEVDDSEVEKGESA